MRKGESSFLLFLTTVMSHLTMLPTLHFLYKRHYIFELCAVGFCLLTSFMYHTAESFNTTFFLSEMEWHRLDNIGIISMLGVWNVYACCLQNPVAEMVAKCCCVIITLIFQQKHPWDVRFTVAPLLLFSFFPVTHYCLLERRLPVLNMRNFATCIAMAALGVTFFVLGLDDASDPYRIFHGLWHFFGGLASFFSWSMVRHPGCTAWWTRSVGFSVKGDSLL